MYLDDREPTEYSDEEVLARSIRNPELFRILVDRYQEAFIRKARRVLGNRDEVEDAVQETFTKIYVHAGSFKKQVGAQFSSWGYKILMNTCFTYYQKLKRRGEASVRLDDEIWALIPDRHAGGETREARDYVASILARMPEPLARVLSFHFIEDMPQQDIADREGVSVAAIKTRVHRAKKEFERLTSNMAF